MRGIQQFILNFLNRSGGYIFGATIISRLLSFSASWIALQLIPNKELGVVLFAFNIIGFIIPFGGLGLHQGLLRYGALLKTEEEKNSLFMYVLKNGIISSFFLVVLVIISSFFIPFQFENTGYYVAFLSLVIIPHYLLSIIKIQFRLKHNNKTLSYIEITYNVLLIITVSILCYLFNAKGYAFALFVTPYLTILFFIKKLNINRSKKQYLILQILLFGNTVYLLVYQLVLDNFFLLLISY
ncbi:hypothetical protein Lupro_05180 [Lutibacter profundi]|uniref:Polysaccharide biosynthesis protein C-terminal domain-containing protein n=1 Tax=Lutibacter profundi TaxID=1622118 RepID=A0A0X8G5Y7_9FLAO|nr:hypothetical protein [Lutibacter profundi]AMC10671.1 hypothetical protein Lupro_05180 [Lutibacter profundi]